MRRLLPLIALLLLATPARATFSLVQHPTGVCSGGTNCSSATLSVTSTGSGHLLVLMVGATNGSSGNISAVSDGQSGTWTIDTNCHTSNGTVFAISACAYNLSSPSSITSLSITFSASNVYRFSMFEYSFTGSSVSFDTSCNTVRTSSSTTQTGCGIGTLSGTNDVIVRGSAVDVSSISSISSPYTLESTSSGGGSAAGFADLANTTSTTSPTWTLGASGALLEGSIAFKEVGGGGGPPIGQRPKVYGR